MTRLTIPSCRREPVENARHPCSTPDAGGGVSPMFAGTPHQGAVIARTRELVEYARGYGYNVDELIRIIEKA